MSSHFIQPLPFPISSFPFHSIETKGPPLYLSSKDAHEGRKTSLFCPSLPDHSPLPIWSHKKPKPRPSPPQSYMSTRISMRTFMLIITSWKSQKRQANNRKLHLRSWVGGNWNKIHLLRQATRTWEVLYLSQHPAPYSARRLMPFIHNRKLRELLISTPKTHVDLS